MKKVVSLIPVGLGFVLGCLLFDVHFGCSAPVGKIAPLVGDASAKRDAICNFAEAWKADTPELVRVQQLCKAGSDLKTIAAAYAGCVKPPEDAGAPPVAAPVASPDAATNSSQ